MTRSDERRRAGRELWPLVTMWLGFGAPDTDETPVRRGAAFLLVQTVIAVVLGGALGAGWPWLAGRDVAGGHQIGMLVLALPLAAGIARTPPRLARALVLAVPAGVAAGALAWWPASAALSGFWLWFAVLAVGALTAGPIFGALAGDGSGGGR